MRATTAIPSGILIGHEATASVALRDSGQFVVCDFGFRDRLPFSLGRTVARTGARRSNRRPGRQFRRSGGTRTAAPRQSWCSWAQSLGRRDTSGGAFTVDAAHGWTAARSNWPADASAGVPRAGSAWPEGFQRGGKPEAGVGNPLRREEPVPETRAAACASTRTIPVVSRTRRSWRGPAAQRPTSIGACPEGPMGISSSRTSAVVRVSTRTTPAASRTPRSWRGHAAQSRTSTGTTPDTAPRGPRPRRTARGPAASRGSMSLHRPTRSTTVTTPARTSKRIRPGPKSSCSRSTRSPTSCTRSASPRMKTRTRSRRAGTPATLPLHSTNRRWTPGAGELRRGDRQRVAGVDRDDRARHQVLRRAGQPATAAGLRAFHRCAAPSPHRRPVWASSRIGALFTAAPAVGRLRSWPPSPESPVCGIGRL